MRWTLFVLACSLAAMMALGTGCGGGGNTVDTGTIVTPPDPPDPPPPPPPPPTTASIRGFINFPGTYTVTLKRNNVIVGGPIITSNGAEPPFEFTDEAIGDGYTIEVDNGDGILTVVRPFSLTADGESNVDVLTRLKSQLESDQIEGSIAIPPVDGTATLVAYAVNDSGLGHPQIVLDGAAPTPAGNPTWLTGVTSGPHQVMVLPEEMMPFTLDIPSNTVVVIRSLFHRLPQVPGDY